MLGNTGFLRSHYPIRKSAIEKGVDSKVRELAQGDLNRISIEMIGKAALQNDSLSFRVLHEAVSHIAVALADVVNLLNPHVLIFGGALFRSAPELFLEPLKRTIKQRALEKSANEVQLKISTLGDWGGRPRSRNIDFRNRGRKTLPHRHLNSQ